MKLPDITDIFFDLDHTLWDFDRNSRTAFDRVFLKHNLQVHVSDFISVYEPINLEYWKLFREERVSKQDLRRGRLIDAFAKLDLSFQLNEIDAMAVSYIDELPVDNHLFDGAQEMLAYLKPKYKLHIITNGFREVQHVKLNNSGIRSYFETVTTSEEVGVKKPNVLVFQSALEKANTRAQSSIMIGDSLEADIEGAANAGMRALFYNYRNEDVKGRYPSIQQLSEIKNYL
ncbi:MAG: noncanonical pyrimidine nucleotidase, YjjG family [Flavobacteriaceae bacterium]|nr:noncanonical pyrimidine nucleotidase, YjjG family [Flavobacteriaceae bacterium]|tara:strand:+ start:856 stop:1545 length:690 start_codon:yes stop_codon:yes gene_type:complete